MTPLWVNDYFVSEKISKALASMNPSDYHLRKNGQLKLQIHRELVSYLVSYQHRLAIKIPVIANPLSLLGKKHHCHIKNNICSMIYFQLISESFISTCLWISWLILFQGSSLFYSELCYKIVDMNTDNKKSGIRLRHLDQQT